MHTTISATISVTKEQIKKIQVQCGFALQSAGFDCDGYSDLTLHFSVDGEEYSSWSLEPFGIETILVFTDEPPHNSGFRMMAFSLIKDAGSSEWILAGDILALTQDEWDDLLNDGIQGDIKLLALTTSEQK